MSAKIIRLRPELDEQPAPEEPITDEEVADFLSKTTDLDELEGEDFIERCREMYHQLGGWLGVL